MRGRFFVLLGAVLWSLGGVGIKGCNFRAWQVAGFRSGIAALTIFLLIPGARRDWSWRTALVGSAMAAAMVLHVWGTKTTTAAHAIFIQCSYPIWVLLLSPFLLKEPVGWRDMLSVMVFGLGLTLFMVGPQSSTALSPSIMKGNMLSVLSGMAYAFYLMGLRWVRGRGEQASVFWANSLGFLVCLVPMSLIPPEAGGGFEVGTMRDWLIMLGLGSVQIGIATALVAHGVRSVPAMQAAIIGLLEPVLNPIWVFLVFHDEKPGPFAIAGAVLILAATALQFIVKSRENYHNAEGK